ncbi:TPA: DUF4306 domain-containing protein [Bacillus luti]|nr:DUF4306 domain-containing protein [Bacillus luti]
MMKRTLLFWSQYILVLPILCITFLFTGFVGSQLMIGDAKEHFVFTPQSVTDYSQIYEIDKLLFSFSVQPLVTTVFLLSVVYVVTLIVFQIIECRKQKKVLHSIQYMILVPIFLYLWFGTMDFSAIHLTSVDNWKDYLVFTPTTIVNEQDVYMIDKFLYKFRMIPVQTTALTISFLYLLTLLVIDSIGLLKKVVVRTNN